MSVKSLVADLAHHTKFQAPSNQYTTWSELEAGLSDIAKQLKGSVAEIRQIRIGDWSGASADVEGCELAKVAKIEHLGELLSPARSTLQLAAQSQYRPAKAPQQDVTEQGGNRFSILQSTKEEEDAALEDIATTITPEKEAAARTFMQYIQASLKSKSSQHDVQHQLVANTHQRFLQELPVNRSSRFYLLGPVVHLHVAVRLLTDEIVRRKQSTDMLARVGRGAELDVLHVKVKAISYVFLALSALSC